MFNRYFQEELTHLKELGKDFSKAHPAVAPMLAGATPDPDVERLLEGVAFLTALLRQKLDDEFPEIINELMQLIWPHYLRPIPSSSFIAFTPNSLTSFS
jgi:type VI secretion system protein ImpG